MAANSLKYGHDHMVRLSGETFIVTRGDVAHQARGIHDPDRGRISFPSETDIQADDLLTSAATKRAYAITRATPHVMDDQVTYIEVWYETPVQQAQRMADERARQPTISIDTIEGSIVNLTSNLSNVSQSIGALSNTGQIDAAILTELRGQLGDVIRIATELMNRLPAG